MENTGKVRGVFDVNFDKREFSAVHIMDGWRTWAMRDVSPSVYLATRSRFASGDEQLSKLLELLDGMEITSAGHLSARNFSFSDEIMVEEDGKLNFYVDADFDVDAAFGTFVLTDKNDDWLNIYANRFFTMGGAKSHDIEDGILKPDAPDFERRLMMLQRKPRARYRINHISWWVQELPSDEEYAKARRNLDAVGWQVDYIITHCAPTSIALMGSRHNEADRLTDFLQEVQERAKYHYWLFGHYHDNRAIDEKHILLWEQIVRVI